MEGSLLPRTRQRGRGAESTEVRWRQAGGEGGLSRGRGASDSLLRPYGTSARQPDSQSNSVPLLLQHVSAIFCLNLIMLIASWLPKAAPPSPPPTPSLLLPTVEPSAATLVTCFRQTSGKATKQPKQKHSSHGGAPVSHPHLTGG